MNMTSKIKLGLVAALAAFGLTAGTAFATSEEYFTFDNGVITGYNGWDTYVEIPATIGGVPVVAIGENAFSGNWSLYGVTIPDSVKDIGPCAFYGTGVGFIAFSGESGLTNIADKAFSETFVGAFVVPASVEHIGENAFSCCTSLSSVKFLGTAVANHIADTAFTDGRSCRLEVPVGWPDTDLPDSDGNWHGGNFVVLRGVGSLEDPWRMGDGVVVYTNATGTIVFGGAGAVSSRWWNEWSWYPWIECRDQITAVQIGKDVTRIGPYAFSDFHSITSVVFEEGSQMTALDEYAFRACALTSIDLPPLLKEICECAFYECDELQAVLIPAQVTNIGESVFEDCTSLESVSFAADSQLEFIGESAFASTRIASVSIPSSVSFIDDRAFRKCKELKKVVFPADCKLTEISRDMFTKSGIENFVVPASVQTIDDMAFSECGSLVSITFANGSALETIEEGVFYACESLASVVIPKSVTTIGEGAFAMCQSLASVEFEEGCKLSSIDDAAFGGTAIERFVFPAGVEELGEGVLIQCPNLTSIEFKGAKAAGNMDSDAFMGVGSSESPCALTLPPGWPDSDKPDAEGNWLGGVFMAAAQPLGSKGNPWSAGDGVTAYTNGVSELVIGGSGAVTSKPWAEYADVITSVAFGEAVTDFGETLEGLPNLAKINGLRLPMFNRVTTVIQQTEVKAFTVNPATKKGRVTVGVMKSATEEDPQWTQGETVDVEIAVPSKVGVLKLVTGVEKTEEKCEE